jgi:hypothetical protein
MLDAAELARTQQTGEAVTEILPPNNLPAFGTSHRGGVPNQASFIDLSTCTGNDHV